MDKPNILLIMTDQQKATASHLYGSYYCRTPQLERLAGDGVLFEQAHTPHPLCVPARISLWSSQFPHTHGGRTNGDFMPPSVQHAGRIWKDAGYHLGLIGKNHCFASEADLALFDTWCEITHEGLPQGAVCRGMDWFRPLDGIRRSHSIRLNMPVLNRHFSYAASQHPLEDYSTGLIAGQTLRFLEKRRREPFVLWVSFPDPHGPWQVPQEYAALFPPDAIRLPPWRVDEFTDGAAPERNRVLHRMMGIEADPQEQVYGLLGAYSGMVRFVDDAVGQILDSVENLGLKENTIVVFCSDHGDFMSEHQMQGKGGVFYDCLTRVPLILSWPGQVAAGGREPGLVSLLDIVPTILRLQGLPVPAQMEGQLLPTVTDAPRRAFVVSEYGAGGRPFRLEDLGRMADPPGRSTHMQTLGWREAEGLRKMVRTHDWKYVHDPLGDLDELYDLKNDPWELYNMAAVPEYREVASGLKEMYAGWNH
jgi:arylsulfatase A-like enzyme